MINNKLGFIVIALISSILYACGGGSSSSGDNASVTGLSSIVGVYQWFDEYPGGIVDEWYFAIDAQGYVSDYDYMGDSYDNLANCYVIDRNWDRFIHISGNRFSSSFGDVFIEIHQGGLLFTMVDGSFDPVYIGPKVNIDVSTFEAAECNSSNLAHLSSHNPEENNPVSKFLDRVKKTP
jgi:hypothetical protein